MKRKLRIKTRILTVITLLLLIISLFPFYYMVVQSFTQWDMVDKVLDTARFYIAAVMNI